MLQNTKLSLLSGQIARQMRLVDLSEEEVANLSRLPVAAIRSLLEGDVGDGSLTVDQAEAVLAAAVAYQDGRFGSRNVYTSMHCS